MAAITGRDQAAANAKSAWTAALKTKTTALPADEKFVAALITVIKSTFGEDSPLLASFGIATPKPKAARSTLQKAVSTALSKNTRVVRGTMSAKERQSITTSGKPGLVVVAPTGEPLLTVAPVPPGSSASPTVTVGAAAAAASSPPNAGTTSPASGNGTVAPAAAATPGGNGNTSGS